MMNFGDGVEIHATLADRYNDILTPEAVGFAVALQREFNGKRKELLAAREVRQLRLDAGERPDFLPDTAHIRESAWTVAPLPKDLLDRRVEITGPVDRKMIINALNSGAKVFMADFEDSTTPTWENLLDGQLNLRDAVRRTITFCDENTGKQYALKENPAVLFVRARGWHLEERHVWVDREAMSGSIFDFALYLFHNAKELVARGSGPYFYLPKIESHLEARLWNDIFVRAESTLGLTPGTIKGTVLIETILATFEMDEILYELRDHSAGFNCGRWDYIFSFIKKLAGDETLLLPDRGQVTMASPFMLAYSKLCIKTCHKRNVSAMGGMSALIPIKSDPDANEQRPRRRPRRQGREATNGHDGTWVAHPGLVPIALEVFDRIMPQSNQIDKQLLDYNATAADLLAVPTGTISPKRASSKTSPSVSAMSRLGCAVSAAFRCSTSLEDAATAEISRAQLWQWDHHHATLEDGRPVTAALCDAYIDEELARARDAYPPKRYEAYEHAAFLMRELIKAPKFQNFLTEPAYARVLDDEVFTA